MRRWIAGALGVVVVFGGVSNVGAETTPGVFIQAYDQFLSELPNETVITFDDTVARGEVPLLPVGDHYSSLGVRFSPGASVLDFVEYGSHQFLYSRPNALMPNPSWEDLQWGSPIEVSFDRPVRAVGAFDTGTAGVGMRVYDTRGGLLEDHVIGPASGESVEAVFGGTIRAQADIGKVVFYQAVSPGTVSIDNLVWARPRLYGVFIGSNDYYIGDPNYADGTIKVNGRADAAAICAAFSHLVPFDGRTILEYDVTDLTKNPQTEIENALDGFDVSPGDNVVFFYSGHGGGHETDGAVDESLYVTRRADTGRVLDDELTAYFLDPTRRDSWRDVNKLFILDSCHSGGFWDGEDADLSSLDHVALLAAAQELKVALTSQWSFDNRRGRFSLALADALQETDGFAAADTNRDGLTVQELMSFLVGYPNYQNGITGYIKDGWGEDPVTIAWEPCLNSTDDFEMIIIPEPATLAFLALGGLAVVRRRTKRSRP